MSIKRVVFSIAAFAGVLFTTAAFAENRIMIGTGSTGGVYYPLGGALAKVIQANIPDSVATAEATGASIDNLQRVAAGTAQIGFSQADTAWDAFKGYGKFGKPLPIRAIAVFYPERLQLVTTQDSDIRTLDDLRHKRISTGNPGSGTAVMVTRLLVANGIDPDSDMARHELAITEAVAALKEKKIDAFFWGGGVPTKAIADLAADPAIGLRFLETASSVTQLLRRYGPIYTDGQIPANTYQQQPTAVKTVDVWTVLVVNENMDEKLVHDIVKALFEHKKDLIAAHVQAQNLELQNQARGDSPIPFHPGARRYFAERGLRILR